jgi:hypothetical protein
MPMSTAFNPFIHKQRLLNLNKLQIKMKSYLVNAWCHAFRYDISKNADYSATVKAAGIEEARKKGLDKIRNYYGFKGELQVIEINPAISLIS